MFEDEVRSRYPGAKRYWEKSGEFDLVRPAKEGDSPQKGIIVTEVKFRLLRASERAGLLVSLQNRWQKTEASHRWPVKRFEILDATSLA